MIPHHPVHTWVIPDHRRASPKGVMFVECLEDNFYEQYVKDPTRGGDVLDLVVADI